MADFVDRSSVVRRIWGDGDVVLLVFAGAAAEFALNRAVDWLFYTGELPRDPIGRLFSTARYAQEIVFADEDTAHRALSRIRAIHAAVEERRGARIPDWAHRDVLYLLIDYSERAYRALYGPLSPEQQDELYDVFHRVGSGLEIPGLPRTYAEWQHHRRLHLERDLAHGDLTRALYAQYRRHLGAWRFRLLLHVQAMLVPGEVRRLLNLGAGRLLRAVLPAYPVLARAGLRPLVRWLLIPPEHLPAVRGLDAPAAGGRPPLPEPAG